MLTGEDGDNPPHLAVSQVASGLGHSHVGRKINIHTRKSGTRAPSCLPGVGASARSQQQQQEPEVRTAFKRASAPSPPSHPDDTWCAQATPTLNRHSSCYGSCGGLTSRDSAAASSSVFGEGGGEVDGWMEGMEMTRELTAVRRKRRKRRTKCVYHLMVPLKLQQYHQHGYGDCRHVSQELL